MKLRAMLAAVFSVALIGGCHSAQAGQNTGAALPDNAWRVSSTGSMHIQYPGGVRRDARPLSIDIRVRVDSSGHADMSSLRIDGYGAAENRATITQWLRDATFKPTAQNPEGHPGYFHQRIEANAP